MSNRTNWKVIGRGLNGWHASGVSSDGNKVSSSGGELETYLEESDPGTTIYDASQADTEAFAYLIISGPIMDSSLQDGQVKMFMDKPTLARMLPGLGGAFQAIGVAALVKDAAPGGLGSLDMIAKDLWIEILKDKVPGVKFGKVNDKHEVEWE